MTTAQQSTAGDVNADAGYTALRDPNGFSALGRAVSYLMTKPSFARQPFGAWSRTLTGQINRGHYFFITSEKRIIGFVGWALTDAEFADRWLRNSVDLPSDRCADGDCMVINAWAADTNDAHRFALKHLRTHAVGLHAAYAKRYYADGRTRPLIVPITGVLASHVLKQR